MKKYITIILAIILIIVISASCSLMVIMKDRIDQLQSDVDTYKPYYTATLAATYGKDGVILAADILEDYQETAALYSQYGISIDSDGLESELKQEILQNRVQRAILLEKAKELGLDELTEEERTTIENTVNDTVNSYINDYISYYYDGQDVTDEMTAEATAYWSSHGIDHDSYLETLTNDTILDKLESYITADITVTDSDCRSVYDSMIEEQKESFSADSDAYITAVNDGDTVVWVPEGYRMVNYILVPFDDDQSERYEELSETLESLQAEKTSLSSEDVDPENKSTRTEAEIDADIEACNTDLDALYAEIDENASTIVSEFESGKSFNEIIQGYCGNLSLTTENQDGSTVYPVCADNTYWERSFTDAAMAIDKPGEISSPVHSAYGTYVIYYDSDPVPGVVPYENVAGQLQSDALATAKENCYKEQVNAWVDEAHPVYYFENIGITPSDVSSDVNVDQGSDVNSEETSEN